MKVAFGVSLSPGTPLLQEKDTRRFIDLAKMADDYGAEAVTGKVHTHDLHATVLHLLGLDHERLTYRYAGRDFRLTDVYGNVVNEIIA